MFRVEHFRLLRALLITVVRPSRVLTRSHRGKIAGEATRAIWIQQRAGLPPTLIPDKAGRFSLSPARSRSTHGHAAPRAEAGVRRFADGFSGRATGRAGARDPRGTNGDFASSR